MYLPDRAMGDGAIQQASIGQSVDRRCCVCACVRFCSCISGNQPLPFIFQFEHRCVSVRQYVIRHRGCGKSRSVSVSTIACTVLLKCFPGGREAKQGPNVEGPPPPSMKEHSKMAAQTLPPSLLPTPSSSCLLHCFQFHPPPFAF
jgi:hypothetical protein